MLRKAMLEQQIRKRDTDGADLLASSVQGTRVGQIEGLVKAIQ